MPEKKNAGGASWSDPDDAPELTDAVLAEAEVFEGDQFVRRGPGRPKAAVTKEAINLRLDPDVLARLRQSGPGWQSRVNAILREALGLDLRAPQRQQIEVKARRTTNARQRKTA